MGFGEEFRKAYGQGVQYRAFTNADRNRLAGKVPGYLLDLWESDGWAGYRNGLLWMVDPDDFAPVLAAWNVPNDPPLIVVARTALGELFLLGSFRAPNGSLAPKVLALDPHSASYSTVGLVAEKFLTRSLADEDYLKATLQEADTKRAAEDVGPIAWNEMYGYEPALALGGSGKPDTVRRLNIFTHHLLLSQLLPLTLRRV
jgi:hypothetical protein